jgi:predicted metal-dependent phosphoesterase TrpH
MCRAYGPGTNSLRYGLRRQCVRALFPIHTSSGRSVDGLRGSVVTVPDAIGTKIAWPMLKVELHTHTADDPVDRVPHSAMELIDRAAALEYNALAITLHDRQLDLRGLIPYASERGVVLIPGVERSIQGRHVLLLNFSDRTETVSTFDDLARLRQRERGLVIAPHPFFPAPMCLRGLLDRHRDLFDGVEYNAMFTKHVNFNRAAERWAALRGKTLVGNGDVHRLHQLGTTYSVVDAIPDADAICAAIAEGRVRVERTPLGWYDVARTLGPLLAGDLLPKRKVPPREPRAAGRAW